MLILLCAHLTGLSTGEEPEEDKCFICPTLEQQNISEQTDQLKNRSILSLNNFKPKIYHGNQLSKLR